jgi:phosphoglycolate phosphatase-like HAD superfamily hydrolase
LDLDGCLFDNRPRQLGLLRAWAASVGQSEALAGLAVGHFQDWDLQTTLRRAGVPRAWVEAHYEALRAAWWRGFFSSDWMHLDEPLPGAVAFTRALAQAGLRPVYLTGRDDTMRPGTERALARVGFPWGDGQAALYTKPEAKEADHAWKARALAEIIPPEPLIVGADNEPANVNLYLDHAPDAVVLWLETDHSPKPEPVHAAALPVGGFLY